MILREDWEVNSPDNLYTCMELSKNLKQKKKNYLRLAEFKCDIYKGG